MDQGRVGSCTGNAAQACCGSTLFLSNIPLDTSARPILGDPLKNQVQALALYSTATTLDSFYGSYPPTDTGSTGLAVAKAAKQAGLISGYLHTFTLDDCLKALCKSTVLIGVNWYTGFDVPAPDGRVRVKGVVRGGHEFLLYGIDAEKKVVKARNSWGTGWGNKGSFYFSFDDLGRLLSEQGDCTVFVPLTSAPPVPSEEKQDPDKVLAAAIEVWKKAKGL